MTVRKAFHPFLLALYPALYFFSKNTDKVGSAELFQTLGFLFIATGILAIIFQLLLQDWNKAALTSSGFILVFFWYGFLHHSVENASLGGIELAKTRYFLSFMGFIFLMILIAALLLPKKILQALNSFLNRLALILILIPVFTSGWHILQEHRSGQKENTAQFISTLEIPQSKKTRSTQAPDIFYIILDGYGRADQLQEKFQYDNSPFLDELSQKGFYVAAESHANYPWTILSIPSSLNFTYFDELAKQLGEDYSNFTPLSELLRHNRTMKFLQKNGYRFVTFSTGYSNLDIKDADLHLKSRWMLTEYQLLILQTTPLLQMLEKFAALSYLFYRIPLLHTLNHLPDVAAMKRDYPVFVFAHVVAPHYPFIFGKNGETPDPKVNFYWNLDIPDRSNPKYKSEHDADYRKGYIDFLVFTNQKIQAAVDKILAVSNRPPVIILQGDHGPAFTSDLNHPDDETLRERMSILNAYYLPGGADKKLYPGITPVNTFRVILNEYFGTDLPLLEDESYFCTDTQPFKHINVTSKL